MTPRRSNRRKKYGQTNLTGQQGVNLVENRVHDMGFAWNPTQTDQGIDGTIEIVESATRIATNLIIQVQVKATSTEFQSNSDTAFSFSCDAADIDYWMNGNAPVILIVCKPKSREAYWKDIKAYFGDPRNNGTKTVRFNKESDKFDASAAQLLADLAKPSGGTYLGTLPKKEKLISNLFPVARFPQTIWSATSKYRDPKKFRHALKNLPDDSKHLREFFLNGNTVYSCLDLNTPPLNRLIEAGTVEENPAEDWALAEDPDLKRHFVHLLNLCFKQFLFKRGVAYDPEKKLNYFKCNNTEKPHKIRAKSLQNTGVQSAAEWHPSKQNDGYGYFRHKAAFTNFVRLDDKWYLEVSPTYFFTSDGRTEFRNAEKLLSGIKRMERHPSVRGNLLLWRAVLSDLDLTKRYDLLSFDPPAEFELEAGIDDTAWQRAGVSEPTGDDEDDASEDDIEPGEDPNQPELW